MRGCAAGPRRPNARRHEPRRHPRRDRHGAVHGLRHGGDILWALVPGFTLSGVVQAVVTKGEMVRLLPESRPRSILIASGLGAASSSCSYAAVALARSIFRKGGDFTAAMAFQFASTNLVLELGLILWGLMGWQFTAAEFVGGPVMIVLLVVLLRLTLRPHLLEAARAQAERGAAGRMEGHAARDMSPLRRSWLVEDRRTADRAGCRRAVLGLLGRQRAVGGGSVARRRQLRRRGGGAAFGLFYVAMAAAGHIVEVLFGLAGLSPQHRNVLVMEPSVLWNYTTVLNIVFLALSVVLVWRFLRTGGPGMLRMMATPGDGARQGHAGHGHRHGS